MGTALFKKYGPTETFNGRAVLNLGCGFAQFKAPNVTNVDAFKVCKPNVVADMEKPLPFKDESYDLILANHVLEHVKNWWGCFEECARILKPGGLLVIFVPGDGNDSQLGYRDHVSLINLLSFYGTQGTTPGTNAWAEASKATPAADMRMTGLEIIYYSKWWIRWAPKFLRRWMGQHLRNIVDEQGFLFTKIKRGDK